MKSLMSYIKYRIECHQMNKCYKEILESDEYKNRLTEQQNLEIWQSDDWIKINI